jgi:hypothetical protein
MGTHGGTLCVGAGDAMSRRHGTFFHIPSFARPITLAFRFAAIVTACSVLLICSSGCRSTGSQGDITWHPPLLPIAISISTDGSIHVSASREFATPLGTFSLGESMPIGQIPLNQTLLVIRRTVDGVVKQDPIAIKSDAKMNFLLDGQSSLKTEGNIAIVTVRNDVSNISIENVNDDPLASRFSTKQLSVVPTPPTSTPLPTSTDVPIPTVTATDSNGNFATSPDVTVTDGGGESSSASPSQAPSAPTEPSPAQEPFSP